MFLYRVGMNDLQGLFVAAITPFDEEGHFRPESQAQHFQWLAQRGVAGALVAGTNGEGPSLSADERRAVIDGAVANRNGLQLLAGTGTPSLQETIALSRYALHAGVDGVLIVPPFYFRDVPEAGLLRYYQAVCDALPPEARVLFYHIPSVSGVPISHAVIRGLIESHPRHCYGIKDTSGSSEHTAALVKTFPTLRVLGGSDHLVADNLRVGVHGQISGLCNAFPELFRDLLAAFHTGEDPTPWQARIAALRQVVKRYPTHAATKVLTSLRADLPPMTVKPPLVELAADQRASLVSEIEALKVG